MPQAIRPIRVLIVDDHPLMREALAAAVSAEAGLALAGEAANGEQALHAYRELRPDVVIMDLLMPVRDGVSATAAILALDPNAHILILTSATDDERVVQALTAGALGYLLKDAERPQLLQGVREVAAGRLFLPPSATGKLVRAVQHGSPPAVERAQPAVALSGRQRSVLALAAGGLSDEQIARQLSMSETTVRVHFHHILAKLGMSERSQAIAWYAAQHLD